MFTGLLIALLAIVGAATIVSGGLVVLARRTERQLAAEDGPLLLTEGGIGGGVERSWREIRVGDVVQRDGADYLVEGAVEYDEDGHRWRAARLVDGRTVRWLMIGLERGGAVSLRWLEEDPAVELNGYPPEKLIAGGTPYTQESRGSATARVAGDAGELADTEQPSADTVLRCRWWRYESAGNKALIVEQWGKRYRALRGELIRKSDIDMMPGS